VAHHLPSSTRHESRAQERRNERKAEARQIERLFTILKQRLQKAHDHRDASPAIASFVAPKDDSRRGQNLKQPVPGRYHG
jgi:hypothetical protein